ncbi:MAG: beta-lactamase family protein, partial [Phaeodactylibacter sp.]|nr:beta-lactamase family protein [Phaeodactylibacter sp.]
NSYLPLRDSKLNHSIRVKDLVTHRSGLPLLFPHDEGLYEQPLDWDKLPFRINQLQAGFNRLRFFESLNQFALDTIPGSKTLYSNAGVNLIGYLLEDLYNQPFDDLLSDKILIPLGMSNTSIKLSEVDTNALARGFNDHKLEMPFRVEKEMNAEGGIISTVGDMVKYLDYHLNSNAAVVSRAHERLISDSVFTYHQGLFWHLSDEQSKPFDLYQLGGAFGTSSWIGMSTASKTGVFIVSNCSGVEVHDKLEAIATEIFFIFNQFRDRK